MMCLYVMFGICFESLASVVPIKLVRAVHCGAPHRTLRSAAHCGTPYVHGQLWEKNDWQFSNPRIDTAHYHGYLEVVWIVESEF